MKAIIFSMASGKILESMVKQQIIGETFKIFLDQEQFDSAIHLIIYFEDFETDTYLSQCIDYLIDQTKKPQFYEFKILFLIKLFDYIKYVQFDNFIQYLEILVKGDQNLFFYSSNPIKLAMILIDILYLIKRKFKVALFRIDLLKIEIEDLTKRIIKAITNSDELKQLLKQKDLRGNDSLYYMSLYNVYTILDTTSTDKILQDFWKSSKDVTGYLIEASSSFRIIMSNSTRFLPQFEEQNRFYKKIDLKKLKSHTFQFEVWKKSMQISLVHQLREEMSQIKDGELLALQNYVQIIDQQLEDAGYDINLAIDDNMCSQLDDIPQLQLNKNLPEAHLWRLPQLKLDICLENNRRYR
ncbi:UNKNOWN [Stylonychia lemnae]|uniref:Uncharacterized protein n=1 Tax=Stylonychia lemnae TaxID=5949 RepID=A0A078AS96_STYLE|nr:UNKNOWN [Stylonychia lemnae]|eukprot:CDW85054.1 UNKNOWN [Stylonychia lemnae]